VSQGSESWQTGGMGHHQRAISTEKGSGKREQLRLRSVQGAAGEIEPPGVAMRASSN